jgi:hypothetical protein
MIGQSRVRFGVLRYHVEGVLEWQRVNNPACRVFCIDPIAQINHPFAQVATLDLGFKVDVRLMLHAPLRGYLPDRSTVRPSNFCKATPIVLAVRSRILRSGFSHPAS